MLRTLSLVLVLNLSAFGSIYAQTDNDKALHFAGGALVGAAGGFLASELSDQNTFWIIAGSVGASLLAGVVKESFDANEDGNSWDNGDLAVTGLGGVTAGVTISIFTGSSKKKKARQTVYWDLPVLEGNNQSFNDLPFNQIITDDP